MKKVLATILAVTAISASAQHDPWRYANQRAYPIQNHRHPQTVIVERNGDWAGPMIGGIILGTVLTEVARRNAEAQQAPAPQPQVIIERQPAQTTMCTEWREVIENGRVYRERTCTR